MTDVQLKDFRTVQGLEGVMFVLVQGGGEGAKASPGLVLSALTSYIRPRIDDKGIWFIGAENTGVLAKAQTPILRFRDSTLEWKYTLEGDESYRPLMYISTELQNFFASLTTEERQKDFVLHPANMTAEEIALLQKPATDKANEVQLAETERVRAEQAREKQESNRQMAESQRASEETKRVAAEAVRESQESKRQTDTAAALSAANDATSSAQDVADHPTKIESDQYVYVWDRAQHKYVRSYKILSVVDLTADQITLLQAPAKEMISQLESTDNAVKTAEQKRVEAETAREQKVNESYANSSAAVTTAGSALSVAESAMAVAKGRSAGYVFQTLALMQERLLDPAFVAKLVVGDNLYIVDNETPDYWWDGEQPQPLETAQIDLTEYHEAIAAITALLSSVDSAEKSRAIEETNRQASETARASAEAQRIKDEAARAAAEAQRIKNEAARAAAEAQRIKGEEDRAAAETARALAEAQRAKDELSRSTEESSRQQQEKLRVEAEKQRVEELNALIEKLSGIDAAGKQDNLGLYLDEDGDICM